MIKTRVVGIAASLLIAACGVAPQPSVVLPATASPTPSPGPTVQPTATPVPFVARTIAGLSFSTPATWDVVVPHVWTAPVGPRLFLSNAPIDDPCAVEFLGMECWKPLDELPPDGILVSFGGSAVMTIPDPSPAAIQVEVSGACGELGGEREFVAVFLGFGVSACLRGPNFAPNEAAFDRLLASMAH